IDSPRPLHIHKCGPVEGVAGFAVFEESLLGELEGRVHGLTFLRIGRWPPRTEIYMPRSASGGRVA
ncbi:MAG: hypothetical protein COZ56_01160, partial [Armatimonadetes bacterium CG_4_8_14_3_um_filter_58_9]